MKEPTTASKADENRMIGRQIININENKIFGVGPKGFRYYCRSVEYDPPLGICSTHPHNISVQILTELGLIGSIFYLISGILFILALRGLSSPETSRQGNLFGIIGMAIAITVTFLSIDNFSSGFLYVILFLLIGGSIGAFIAFKIPMTAMPELVAGFHSLVGLAAVFVAISAFISPEVFNLGTSGNIKLASLIEMSIGAAVGAITFSGSIIAFLKLRGIMSGSPITLSLIHI